MIAAGPKASEIDPALAALRACVSGAADDPAIDSLASKRLKEMRDIHRAGRPLVFADAGRAAVASGRADQARREDREFPADGQGQIRAAA